MTRNSTCCRQDHSVLIGVDPGLTGAVSIYCGKCNSVEFVDVITRMIEGVKKATVKREVDCRAMIDAIESAIDGRPVAGAIIERVGSRAGQGRATGASLAHSMGALDACVCAVSGLSTRTVHPQIWKKALGLTGEGKSDSRELAISEVPSSADRLKRKKDHDRAESLLLAKYLSKIICNQ